MTDTAFAFSPADARSHGRSLQRFLEIVPASCSWLIIFGMLVLTVLDPVIAALIVIAFVLSWLLRMLYSNILLVLSFLRLYAERETDWMERLARMERLSAYVEELERDTVRRPLKERLSRSNHLRDLRALIASGAPCPVWREVYHAVIVPIARETGEIFEPGVAGIARGTFPSARILLVLAVEERAPAAVKEDAKRVREKYRDRFLDLLLVLHPDGLPGEARVKGANATYAAKAAAAELARRGIALQNVVLSCFDADTVISPEYFACLTYHFLICPQRTRASFQPIPLYQNNFWEAPGFARILDVGSSFFQLVEATYPERLVTFSSHSMSFKALADIGYWPVDMISDDSAVYWKAFLHFKGEYRVVPMYVTVSMDITQAETRWKTVANLYKQRRRWAWGVESFPLVAAAFLRASDIPLGMRLRQGYRLLANHVSWATWPFLLGVMSWLPALLIAWGHSHSVLRYSEPQILSTLFNLGLAGFALYATLSQLFLPREKGRHHLARRIAHVAEWLLVPPVSVIFGAVPALDAQTRLMLGRYMEFWVTIKKRRAGGTPAG